MIGAIALRRAMRISNREPWTIATEDGNGWIYYFDGQEVHDGSYGITLEELLDRECVEVYDRPERKHWSEADRREHPYMELEAGLGFIVKGRENGRI